MFPTMPYLAAVNASMLPPQQSTPPFAGMLAANNPNASPPPAPAAPPGPPAPFPGMLAKNAIEYSPEQKDAIVAAGFTPDQAKSVGFVPPSEPLLTSGQRMRAAMTTSAEPPPPAQPESYAQRVANAAFPLTRMPGSGAIVNVPAKETEMRGPTLRAAEADANRIAGRTIEHTEARGIAQAEVDATNAQMQMADAHAREDAIMESAAQREQELQQRQADFDTSVKALSKMSVDPSRFWASRSTGQKIAGVIALTLGGFMQGVRGGSNPGADLINTAIDRDIHAQEAAWHIARDSAAAKQSAFGMAMQKYQNVDAARAAARAAALDAVAAQTNAQQAQWKGVDVSNHADDLRMQLGDRYMNQIKQGIAYTPAQQRVAPTQFFDPRTGIIRNNAQAIEYEKEMNAAGNQVALKQIEGENAIRHEVVKGAFEGRKNAAERQVRLPNGEVITAPSGDRAKELAEAAAAVNQSGSLIARAKQIRAESLTGKPLTPSARAELEGIKSDLLTNYGVAHKLGALSESDYEIARAATGGDIFSFLSATDAALDASQRRAEQGLVAKVQTIPGASPSARGEMPSGTKPGVAPARAQGGPISGGGSYLERVQRAMKKKTA